MIAVDTNILVYAHREEAAFHSAAKSHLIALAQGGAAWAIPWPCIHEFLAVVTHPRVYNPPTPLDLARETIDAWFAVPTLQVLAETTEYWAFLSPLIAAGKIVGPRIHDARIAALCRLHGVRELWSADRDFSRFPDLRVINPLAG